jgi:signal-transduction protein with cAMP-binding, CBS, and nucleotidyltransferase domain
MNKCEELLKSVNIFRHLDSEQQRNIAGVMQFEEYKEDDIILHQDEKATAFFIIAEGIKKTLFFLFD